MYIDIFLVVLTTEMEIYMKKIMCFFICLSFLMGTVPVSAEGVVETDAKSVLLMEQSSGKVLYEENADEKLPIASVTKIMTMLLIMEAVDNGTIKLDDMVSVSENAMSYGGSTMFLEAGEQLSVHDMLKGIAVASANDGCVAMAEFLEGSEAAFIEKMNNKAQELGMTNTHFANTNGLDEDNHYSSARDVAIMSRELLGHEKIFDYTTIWMDTLRDGKFQLANTNKLIRFYNGATGLKTGSTSKALCCLSASAKRDDMQLIAVVLGAPTSAKRFSSAKALLDYGFAGYKIEKATIKDEEFMRCEISKGIQEDIGVCAKEDFSILKARGDNEETQKEVVLNEKISAPINKGDKLGVIKITTEDGEKEVDLIATEDVEKMGIRDIIENFFDMLIGKLTK